MAEYREALRLDPANVLAHANLGDALQAKGLVDEAIAAFREGTRQVPQNADAHYNLGNSLRSKGLLDEAIVEYRETIRLDPAHARAHDNLGIALAGKDLFEEAIAAFREAIHLDPSRASAHLNLAEGLRLRDALDEALVEIREAIRLDPGKALARHVLGLILQAQGLLDEATDAFGEAVRLEPGLARAHAGLGSVLLERGRFADAVAVYREAVRLDPGRARGAQEGLGKAERMAALERRLPAVLEGEGVAASAEEAFGLAEVATLQRRYALALRFHREGLAAIGEADPVQLSDRRYYAACAAVQVAAGADADGVAPDEEERAGLRAEARAWLRANLAVHQGRLPEAARDVTAKLEIWRTDRHLASIRDDAEVAKLPPEEQEACRALWRDVEGLLERAKEAVR